MTSTRNTSQSQPVVSMTGYAAVSAEFPAGRFALELKTVNHRYLELQIRLPDELRMLEVPMRELAAARISRGKVDCRVHMTKVAGAEPLRTDPQALSALAKLQESLLAQFDARPLSVWEILHAPGVMLANQEDLDSLRSTLLSLLTQAIVELNASREREGAKLVLLLEERLDKIETLVAEVTPIVPQMVVAYQEKLAHKLNEVLNSASVDERLHQEVILYASRIDVAEELNRLSAHVAEVRRVLRQGGAVGKRLDFLMQELNREANTLGSKSVSVDSTRIAVELKVLIEQMREQIQNVE